MIARLRTFCRQHQDSLLIAARVGVAATLAYLVGLALQVHETFWPVLSAVIVARGGAQGAGGSARDRLLGTLAGAAVGMVAAALHNFGVPDWLILFCAMAPMGFLSADKAAFRAAPMAAMIVLSAASSGKSGTEGAGVAILRVLDVGLGSAVALFVSQVLLPANPARLVRRDASALMMPLANLLSLAVRPDDEEARDKFTRLNGKIRRELRDLVAALRQLGGDKGGAGEGFAQALVRTHGTIVFISRALGGAPLAAEVATALKPAVGAARAQFVAIGEGLGEGKALPPIDALSGAVAQARQGIVRHAADNPAIHLEALPFLWETLRDDLAELAVLTAALPALKSG
jgi:uncharacterized membrane protein YccC